ncbi:hypothetical protein AAVH_29672 [Aphelenchoides avenae]|nr:hypothetical protein AAVH_29672 [Aphelenchus avenae]
MMDTPGIGDTDGVHKDQINEQKIVNAISKLPHLNMILMLFKATDNRFSEPYRYCITELLLRLHESTTANIAFCFTHTRCERYTPGQAAGPLKSYLNMLKERHGKVIKWDKTNAFFLDNEAVRFVYGYQSGVGFDQQDLEDSARSWDRSVAEMTRMFRYAASLQPHDVNKTVSMNRAREAVLIFAKPLVDINDLIETNKQLLAEHQAKVAVLEPVIEELRNNLEFMHVAYEREMLDHPRTVCSRCATVETVPNTTEKQVVYTQICHSRCKLPGVALERFPQPGLKKCRAMAWNLRSTCIWCKCGWEHHLHINFSQVKKPRTFKDMRKEEQLHEETDALLLKQRLIADCTRQMGEFLEEQRIIKAASVRFAAYLKQNAILPYNDVYEEYAKLCIENEEMCVRFDRNRDRTKLKNLRRCLAEYRQERDAIIAGIEAGKGVERVDTDDIERCKQQLFGLKHNGAELHKLYDAALAGYEHYKDAGFELTGPKFWDTHGKKKSSKSLMAHAKSAAKHPIKSAAAAYRYLTSE